MPYGGGPFGFISGPSQHAMGWEPLLLVQIVFFLFVVFGCVGMRLVARRGKNVPQGIIGAVGYVAAALLGLVMQPMLDGMPAQNAIIACTVLSAVAGIFFTPPFIFWVDRLRDQGKTTSHCGLTGVLILCYLLCPAAIAACSVLSFVPYYLSVA